MISIDSEFGRDDEETGKPNLYAIVNFWPSTRNRLSIELEEVPCRLANSNHGFLASKAPGEKLYPRGVKALFAQNARYFETLYQKPLEGIEAIYGYWSAATGNQADVQFSRQTIAFVDQTGVAR